MFEGKPPELKRAELAKRGTKREDATAELEAAKEVRAAARVLSLLLFGWAAAGRRARLLFSPPSTQSRKACPQQAPSRPGCCSL